MSKKTWIDMIDYALQNKLKIIIVKGTHVEDEWATQEELCDAFKWAKNAEVIVKRDDVIYGQFSIELGKNEAPINVKGHDTFIKEWNEWTPL